jgi:threonine dehydratase
VTVVRPLEAPTLDEVRAAAKRIAGIVVRTPLVPFEVEGISGSIHLKLENLQPIGSFKLRGAGNAMLSAGRDALAGGVVTASAGNMAQGMAWNARRMGIPCTVVVPDSAPETKLRAIERLGGRIVKAPFARWWQTLVDHGYPGIEGRFIHPVSDPAVIAGNGTVGLEIMEDLPDVDTILVAYGGGGLSCGIASAVRALSPRVRIYACEVATAAPLRASLEAGAPRATEYVPSFVDGIGSGGLLEEMWPLASRMLAGSLVVSVEEVAAAVRLLVERARVVAEGAGATPVAAALAGKSGGGKVVCVVSGGNIDPTVLARILRGEVEAAAR